MHVYEAPLVKEERETVIAHVYLDEHGCPILHIWPRIMLSKQEFERWFPDSGDTRLDIDTPRATAYSFGEIEHWTPDEREEYFKDQLPKFVDFLYDLMTGPLVSNYFWLPPLPSKALAGLRAGGVFATR